MKKDKKIAKVEAQLNEVKVCLQDEKLYRTMIDKDSLQWKESKERSKNFKAEKFFLINKLEKLAD